MPESALTTSDYWSRWHRTHVPRRPGSWRRLRGVLRWLNRGHESHLELVRARATDPDVPRQGTLIELGCAPGRRLLQESDRMGLEPHGVDYSEVGYRATVDTFAEHGADASGIMHADFTAEEFRRADIAPRPGRPAAAGRDRTVPAGRARSAGGPGADGATAFGPRTEGAAK